MDIQEMHVLFRLLGQQMGLQTVRGILPEEIDSVLNDAIVEKVRSICIQYSVVDFKNKIAIDRNAISNLNALRTLYKETTDEPIDVMLYLGISVKASATSKEYGCRLIDPVELENTLNDYCNRASKDYPIATIINEKVNIYPKTDYSNPTIKYKYLKNPNVVSFTYKVDCDLPEYLHQEIVELAVSKFYKAVGYTTPTSQSNN